MNRGELLKSLDGVPMKSLYELMTPDERRGVFEQWDDDLWVDRQRAVEAELTWTLNLLDRVEDDTRRIGADVMRQARSAYDTRFLINELQIHESSFCNHGRVITGYCWQCEAEEARRDEWRED